MLNDMFVSTYNEEDSIIGGSNSNYVEHFGSTSQLEGSQYQAHHDPQPLTSEEMMMLADYPINHIVLPSE